MDYSNTSIQEDQSTKIANKNLAITAFIEDGKKGFRGSEWGASMEDVLSTENLERIKTDNKDELMYKGTLYGKPCEVYYSFFNNKLYNASYSIAIDSKENSGSYNKYWNQNYDDSHRSFIEFVDDYSFMRTYIKTREDLCNILGNPSKGNEKNSLWQKLTRRGYLHKNIRECVSVVLEDGDYNLSAEWIYPASNERLYQTISLSIRNVKLDYSEVYIEISYVFSDIAFDVNESRDFLSHVEESIKKQKEDDKNNNIDDIMAEYGLDIIVDGFRNNKWKDTRDDVFEVEDEAEFKYDMGKAFAYEGKQYDLPCTIFFQFDEDELSRGFYSFHINNDIENGIREYQRIGKILSEKYKEPADGSLSTPLWNDSDKKYYGKDIIEKMKSGDIKYQAIWHCGLTGIVELLSMGEEGDMELQLMYYDYFKLQMDQLNESYDN